MESGEITKITKIGRIAGNSPGSSQFIRKNRPADAWCVGFASGDKDPHERKNTHERNNTHPALCMLVGVMGYINLVINRNEIRKKVITYALS
jgi:hypothetical protein